MNHTKLIHENCEKQSCPYCDGGLFLCTICGGFEGSLTTECPGKQMTEYQEQSVCNGFVDFKNGRWVCT